MYPCMKLRFIEEVLQDIREFEKPKILLEQYATPTHLASNMLHTIQVIEKVIFLYGMCTRGVEINHYSYIRTVCTSVSPRVCVGMLVCH